MPTNQETPQLENELPEEFKIIVDQLCVRWQECSFHQISKDMTELKKMAEESTYLSFFYSGLVEIAELTFNNRAEDVTGRSVLTE